MGKERVMSGKPTYSQGSLDFGRSFLTDDAFSTSMLALRDAYMAAGNMVAAGATGIDRSDLPKMFEFGSGRHLRYKAVFQIGALDSTSRELRRRILEPQAKLFGFDLVDHEPMTDKERADRLEAAMRAMPLGEQLVANVLGGRR
jgi:hypothetical protein